MHGSLVLPSELQLHLTDRAPDDEGGGDNLIPTLLGLGLIIGVVVKTWWSIPALAALWVVWVGVETDDWTLGTLSIALLLGAVNAGIGVALGRGVRYLFSLAMGRKSSGQRSGATRRH